LIAIGHVDNREHLQPIDIFIQQRQAGEYSESAAFWVTAHPV
jgi:hypothetical protein